MYTYMYIYIYIYIYVYTYIYIIARHILWYLVILNNRRWFNYHIMDKSWKMFLIETQTIFLRWPPFCTCDLTTSGGGGGGRGPPFCSCDLTTAPSDVKVPLRSTWQNCDSGG